MASANKSLKKPFWAFMLVLSIALLIWVMIQLYLPPSEVEPEEPEEPAETEETEVLNTEPVQLPETEYALVQHLSKEVPRQNVHVINEYTPPFDISVTTAEHIMSWQLEYEGVGGWSKDFPQIFEREWDGNEDKSYQATQNRTVMLSHLDNDATTTHILYLAAVYTEHGGSDIKASILNAMDMILKIQHKQGSWPECYPEQTFEGSDYENHGTINDEVHYNNLSMFQKIINKQYPFDNDLFDNGYRQAVSESYDRALDFVIKSQLVNLDGELTLWAGKYDQETYDPIWARHFEPPALMNHESQMILFHLLSIPDKNEEIVNAIYHGVMWIYENAKLDLEYRVHEPPYFFTTPGMKLWYRFHDVETNEGIFALNFEILYDIMELTEERRHGFLWATDIGTVFYDETKIFLEMD